MEKHIIIYCINIVTVLIPLISTFQSRDLEPRQMNLGDILVDKLYWKKLKLPVSGVNANSESSRPSCVLVKKAGVT